MKLIIDISKDRYDEIMEMDWRNCRRFFDEEIRAIHDGMPQRTGYWIKNGETDENGNAEYMCSECTHGDVHAETQIVPFCWWCGTKMFEPQESEEQA